jgi:hypothetical protein
MEIIKRKIIFASSAKERESESEHQLLILSELGTFGTLEWHANPNKF